MWICFLYYSGPPIEVNIPGVPNLKEKEKEEAGMCYNMRPEANFKGVKMDKNINKPTEIQNNSKKFSWTDLPEGYECLSPMAGVTDTAFRQICKRHGADVVFTEMASANMMLNAPTRNAAFLHYEEWERPIIGQIMGGDAKTMAEAARVIEDMGFDGVDVNMGCPEKKIVGNACGSSLLRDADTAARIVEAMANAVNIPVSVKMRSGFYDSEIVQPQFAIRMQEAGAKALAIHPRTKEQAYRGSADWTVTRLIVENVQLPVGGSGDVTDRAAIERLRAETGVQGIWVARGAMGNPWIFERERTERPPLADVIATALEHARLMVKYKGPHGMIEMRKHLTWYFSGFQGAAALREQVKTVSTYEDLERLIEDHQLLERFAA
ncbi:MAG: tRNA-dihydrouridine synthase [Chloroflexi bacterium]|jgi:tRNA-dihydrouridine synthase B|nr:tRNA-dihydrouridine synthase [Chloroflexota bacterium]